MAYSRCRCHTDTTTLTQLYIRGGRRGEQRRKRTSANDGPSGWRTPAASQEETEIGKQKLIIIVRVLERAMGLLIGNQESARPGSWHVLREKQRV